MATRSVYFIKGNSVCKDDIQIKWESGFAYSQKQKNIENLHEAISKKYGINKEMILEVSTKSPLELGKMLSSINLKFRVKNDDYYFESVYQSSKVFSNGLLGEVHHPEWIELESFEAKKASKTIGLPLLEFRFNSQTFPLEPPTMFFDWLYIRCIHQLNIKFLLKPYSCFTDIEFNPSRMISTQAHALCLYKNLANQDLVEKYLENPIKFY